MKTLYLDIETVPADTATLEKLMPPEVSNPVMPEEIANPIEPNWSEKCPKYGGDENKRQEWIKTAVKKWAQATAETREKWQQAALDARARFVESAALHAESGHVKMIGLSVAGERVVYLWEPDREKVAIAQKEAGEQKIARALFHPFMLEKQMFQKFAKDFVALMNEGETLIADRRVTYDSDANRVITYYGNTFDLPFLARRAAIVGEPLLMRFLRQHKRGRYLDAARFVDLHEEWVMTDRETRTGGLDGLCKIFGIEGKSAPCGGSFYKFYSENPAEGLVYLLRDLAATEACAQCMGFE